MRLLLDKGADPKKTDATGKAPICYAVGRGYANVARVFLDHSIDVNTRYGNDLTALMWAAGHEDAGGSSDVADVLVLLIGRGARLNDQDNRGRTALMIAASLGHEKAVDVLLAEGATRDCATGLERQPPISPPTKSCARSWRSAELLAVSALYGQTSKILRNGLKVRGLRGIHQIRHARIVATCTITKIGHRFQKVFGLLASKPRVVPSP